MDDLQTAIRNFYICYDLLNRLCWGGRLPPCQLGFSKRMRRAWATADVGYKVGGHGKDFYGEMERIGIMGRTNMSTREGYSFSYVLFMYSLKNIKSAEAMKIINQNNVCKKFEESMFNQYKESVLCR